MGIGGMMAVFLIGFVMMIGGGIGSYMAATKVKSFGLKAILVIALCFVVVVGFYVVKIGFEYADMMMQYMTNNIFN